MHTETLQTALAHHQRGEIEPAVRLYQQILAADPNHVDALHLLGVAAMQVGDLRNAEALIRKAITLKSDVAGFHANLGEVYRLAGRLDLAGNCCARALELQPNYPEARNNLGLVRLEQGRTDEAMALFRAALELVPNYPMALNNLADAYRRKGDLPEAEAHYRRALELNPNQPLFRCNLGQLLLEQKRLEEALEHSQVAVRLQPRLPAAHNNLGNVLRELGRLTEARACYAEAVRLNPRLATAHDNLGLVAEEEGQIPEAVRCFAQALQLEPNVPRLHANLGNALREARDLANAAGCFRNALALDPQYAEAHVGLGLLAYDQGRFDEAEQHYREALQHRPGLANAHLSLGQLRAEYHDLPAALDCVRAALRHEPTNAHALALLAALQRGKLPAEEEQALRRLADAGLLSDGKRAMLLFALGQLHDARRQYDEAGDYFLRANALERGWNRRRGKAYDPAVHAWFVDQVLAAFTPELFERTSGWGVDSERPVFIFGLPRSGTTLVEQVLASHSQVFGAGELLQARFDFEALSPGGTEGQCFAALENLNEPRLRRLADAHLGKLAELDAGAARVTDKMPDNYMYVGLLHLLFPRAKFIHCRRDLRDVAVSCWTTQFGQVTWANTFDEIASRFREYRRLMDHWAQVLPVPVLDVDYEDTVDDLEGVARRLVEWCDLEWEPACLEYHRTERPIRTASVTQVRQPIYKHSVGRWKNYESTLAPLFRQLEELGAPDLVAARD